MVSLSSKPLPVEIAEKVTVARDGEILGTWLYSDVLDYVADGRLSPSDHYLDKRRNQWKELSGII
jgi:hypothetical protein